MRRVVLVVAILFVAASASAQSNRELLRGKLVETIHSTDRELDGVLGVGILDLTTGDMLLHNADQVFPIASTIKIAILAELLRQKVNLDDTYTLRTEDIVGGSGVLQRLTPGRTILTMRDLATLTVTESDNTATNILIGRLGMDRINASLERAGMQHTRLRRRMMDARAAEEGRENTSTPREMLKLLEQVYRSEELMSFLSLPKDSYIPEQLPAGLRIANKPGSLSGVRSDAGIVLVKDRPFALAVMTTFAVDEAAAEKAIATIAAAAYRYFDRLARSSEHGRALR